MNTEDEIQHPDWFRLELDGPHKMSGGLDTDDYSIVYFCAKDGEPWPCPEFCREQGPEVRP